MKKSIDEIMNMLNENNDEETQKQGIELGKKIKNFNVFIRPQYNNKPDLVWKNCLEIICNKTSEELLCYDRNLIIWWKENCNKSESNKLKDKLKDIYVNTIAKEFLNETIRMFEKQAEYQNVLEMLLEIKQYLEVTK